MRFKFKAQKADGTFYESEREATDKYALARVLEGAGETPIHVVPAGEKIWSVFNRGSLSDIFHRISIHDKIVFARNLGGMVGAGLSVSRALAVLERQTENPKLKKVIGAVAGRVGGGMNLSQAFGEFKAAFPPIFVSMVAAGEEGGTLSASLHEVASQLDRAYYMQKKVRGALMYPAIVVVVLVIIAFIMMVYVVPQLTSAFKEFNVALPFSTRVVIATSDFAKTHTVYALLSALGVAAAVWLTARSAPGKRFFDFAFLHMPIISPLVKNANAARTGSTLSSLLSAGVPVVSALQITAKVISNSYYQDVLLSVRVAIQKGESMSSVFREHEDIYPAFLSEMVAVGEETGKLSSLLRECGAFFEAEVDQKTKDLGAIIEPLLIVAVGAAVGFFAVAMIAPMYSLMNSI